MSAQSRILLELLKLEKTRSTVNANEHGEFSHRRADFARNIVDRMQD